MTEEYKEQLIDFLVDTWEEAMEEGDLVNFYREHTRYNLEDQHEETLLDYAETYDFKYER